MKEETKPAVPQRVQEINAEIARQGNKGFSVAPPSIEVPKTITPEAMTSNPEALEIPRFNATPTTSSAVIGGTQSRIQSMQDEVTKQYQDFQTQAQNEASKTSNKLLESVGLKTNILNEKMAALETPEFKAKKEAVNKVYQQQQELQKMQLEEEASLQTANMTGEGARNALFGVRNKYAYQNALLSFDFNAKQNNYQSALDDINTMAELKMEAAQPYIDYYSKLFDVNQNRLTDAQKEALQAKKESVIFNRDREVELEKTRGQLLLQAYANNAPESVTAAIKKAGSLEEAVGAAGQYGTDVLERQIKQAQLDKLNIETARIISESIPQTAKQETESLSTINDINNILSSNAIDQTFGITSIVSRNVPGTESYGLSKQVNNLLNKLALAARGQLKGQGAVSDFEGRMLKEAQTALTLNMSPEQARAELAKVRGALATSSGGNALVKMTNPNTNESQLVEVSQAGINQAIKDGLQVEYQ